MIKLGIYKHYKGGMYKVLGVAKHSETLEDLVMYEAIHDNKTSKLWARPIHMFNDLVEIDGVQIPRFEFIRE